MAQKKNIGKSFAQFLTKQLLDAPDVASQILSSYEIIDDSAEDVGLKNILKLANDIMFYVPTISLAKAWKTGAAYVYRFDQANPWEGPWQGNACHITDLSMLLQNFDAFLPNEHKEVGRKFAKDLFVFASGVAPWTAYEGEKPFVQKYGSLQGGRREFIWKIVDRVGADRLASLLEAFIVEG
jgi:carboxylesterase type B